MTREILEKLFELMEANIDYLNARDSSDGGLIERIVIDKIKKELEDLVDKLSEGV
jgi:hypothetical protein